MQKHRQEYQKEPPAYPIASVDNALRLLLMFQEMQRLRLSDVSAYLGVAHSTAHRLLAMLSYHGFVRQERGLRTYVPGPAIIEIGLAAVHNMDLRTQARPVLEKLAEASGETVHLAHLEGNMIRYLDAVESRHALRVAGRTGNLLPAGCTATGKALLAHLPPAHVRRLYPDPHALPAQTDRSITELDDLMMELRRIRRIDYATNTEESEDGVVSVATAVYGAEPDPVATLSVSAPIARADARRQTELGALLRTAADRLGNILTGRTDQT